MTPQVGARQSPQTHRRWLSGFSAGFALWLWSVVCSANSASDNVINLHSEQAKFTIAGHAEYILVDKHLPIEAIAGAQFAQHWQNYAGSGLLGHADQEIWFRFSATQVDSQPTEWWLAITWPMLRHAQLFVFDNNTQSWSQSLPVGYQHPLRNREVKNRFLIFPQEVSYLQSKTYYLNIRSDYLLSVPIDFWRSEDFVAYTYVDLIILSALLGAMVIMLLYNGCLSVLLNDKTYRYYSLYVGSTIVYLVITLGIGVYYFWPNAGLMNAQLIYMSAIGCFAAATLFIRYFLKLPEFGGFVLLANTGLQGMWAFLSLGVFFFNSFILGSLLSLASIISAIILVLTCIVLIKHNHKIAKIFIIAWSLLIVGTIVFVLTLSGLLPINPFTTYSQMAGFAVELALLSIALAYRINSEKAEREAAQSQALVLTKKVSEERRERLKAQMDALELQRQHNEELERHVVERTEQLNDAMLKLELANQELVQQSITDPLTKVHNRRYFDDTLINEYKRALRSRQPLGLIVADIDNFKYINDTYGHTAGDQCIAMVAAALKQSTRRSGDVVARYGGEEFVLILPGSDEKDALVVADLCRTAVEDLSANIDGEQVALTISAGVAAWIPTEDGAYKQLLNAADTALYRAKNNGRNCVAASERTKLAQV